MIETLKREKSPVISAVDNNCSSLLVNVSGNIIHLLQLTASLGESGARPITIFHRERNTYKRKKYFEVVVTEQFVTYRGLRTPSRKRTNTMTIQANKMLFEQTTDPEVIRFTHLQNSATWKSKYLTAEEYAQREQILGSSEIALKGSSPSVRRKLKEDANYLGLKYFVFKDLSLPDTGKTSQIVSSCETLNRVAWCIHPESHGEIEPVLSVCIGGVYTIPEHRGKKFAQLMITQLNEYYDKLSQRPGASSFLKWKFMFLYSEVGDYYEKFGYVSEHVPLHSITQLDDLYKLYCEDSKGRYLSFDDYEDLVSLQKTQFKAGLKSLHSVQGKSYVFTVEPSLDIYKWFQHRDVFLSQKFQDKPPSKFGFRLEDDSHIIWHHHWLERSLYVLKVYVKGDHEKESVLQKLLGACVKEAKAAGLSHIEFWDEEINADAYPKLFKLLEKVEDGSNVYAENGSRSAVRVPSGLKEEEFTWANNTKFCWF